MTKLETLIQQLCPDGVEYKELGEIAPYPTLRIDASEVDANTYVGVDNLLPDKQGKTVSTCAPVSGRLIAFQSSDVLIGNIRPYLKKIWLATHNGGTNGDVLTFHINDTERIAPKFLYYILSSDAFFHYDMQFAKGAKMPRGDKAAVLQYTVPVPPLEVQQEIVRILDSFTARTTELQAQLNAELTARKQQYEYYRDSLLRFSKADNLSIYKMSEITKKIYSGKNKDKNPQGLYPVYGSTGIISKTNNAVYSGPKILVARVGANAGYIHIADGTYDVSDNTLIIDIGDKILLKFLYHLLVSMNLRQYAKGGGQPLITAGQLKTLEVPVPPLAEQERIVAILDRFDALCNDLTSGLPAEIEARQKQYEYYRDKLLTFPEKVNGCHE